MDYVTELSNLIMNNLPNVILGMTVMILLALVLFISINIKLAKIHRQYRKMMKGMEGVNIEEMLLAHIEEVRQGVRKVDNLTIDCQRMEEEAKKTIQKFGVVRFNAFENMGSDLSFAIALLDYQNNGMVISSIYSRTESHTYAKPVVAGNSSYFLTEEEKQALTQAMEKK